MMPCRYCGHVGEDVHEWAAYTPANGSHFVTQCDTLSECWARQDRAMFTQKEEGEAECR